MNFHKTIGFLASLLLMVGFGVPDSFAQTITITVPANQRSIEETATDVTVSVVVAISGGSVTTGTVTATLGGTPTDTPAGTPSGTASISVNASGNSTGNAAARTIAWAVTLTPDANADDEEVTLTVTAPIGTGGATVTSNSVTITIEDTQADLTDNAEDASGFRLTMAAPGPGKWAKVGANQVKIQLHRRAGLASEWGNYASIAVALYNEDDATGHDNKGNRDTDPVPDPLYQLTVDNDTELGSLVLASMKTDTLTSTAATGTGNSIVAYKRRTRTGKYDVMEFRFNIPNIATAALTDASPGILRKVYAVATFSVGGSPVGSIESRETEDTIYPANPSAFPDKVGDGRYAMVDRNRPDGDIINSMVATITDKNDNTMGAGIGDEIELKATIDGVFREHSVVFQIIHPAADIKDENEDGDNDPTTDTDNVHAVIKANEALVGFGKTFSATDIFTAGNNLSHKFKVTANQFKRKYNLNDPINDPRKYKKNDLREDDQMTVRARAAVKDQAGNSTNQYVNANTLVDGTVTELTTDGLSDFFTLDSKPPKVKIIYPKPSAPDSNRFTAMDKQEYEFLGEGGQEVDLNPLKFSVDEAVFTAGNLNPLSAAANIASFGNLATPYVVLDGNHAARRDTLLLSGVDEGDNTINLSLAAHKHRPYVRTDNGKNDTGKASADNAYNKGTKTAKLTVAVTDLSGNVGRATPSGGDPIFDNKAAAISKLFPNTADLEPYDNKIGGPEGTQHPVFRLNEAVDSILVRYEGGGGSLDVVGTDAQNATVNNNIRVSFMGDDALQDGEIYDLQVYVRDLAGHVTLSAVQEGLIFENDLSNPAAGAFKLATLVRKWNTAEQFKVDKGHVKMDSVVANQGMRLDITALDAALTESAGEDRRAITYAKAGVKVVVMDSDGNPEPSAKFWGGASGNGTATLNDLGWSGGERSVFFQVKKAGSYTIAVKDMNADGTVNFMKTTDIVVDAADFQMFTITAWEEGVEGPAMTVWDDFDLQVVPTDAYGNASLKTFHNFTGTGKVAPVAAQDSLDILDTRVGKGAPTPENAMNTTKKYSHVDVNFATSLIEDLPFSWSVAQAGDTFTVRTQENRTRGTARVRAVVDNNFLLITDVRSRNKSGDASFAIGAPLDIAITLWVPGMDGDQAGETVTIPAGGSVDVTARAENLNEGDTVTFNVGDMETEATADADGYATQSITLTGSGTVTVTASVGQYSESLDIVHEEQMGRVSYTDAEGNPVYLIAKSSGTVGVDDFLAFLNAYGSSVGDANYNPQADVNDDNTVNLDDYLIFITSFGRTAGPSTKPLVLATGVNQNAEFALSLGSERVLVGELVAVDVSLANVEALMGYGFTLNYDATKFEFVSVAQADEDLLKSTGGETLFHHVAGNGQVEVATGLYNGTAVSGGGDIARFVFRVLYEFEDNARFEIANGLVFDPSQLQNPAVVAGVLELQSTPREFALHQNFPNPFNPDTTIKYDLAESADVTLQIYNVLGQVVRTLVASEAQDAGRYQIRWNGMDERGVPVSSGIYFYQIAADGKFSDVRKLMLLK